MSSTSCCSSRRASTVTPTCEGRARSGLLFPCRCLAPLCAVLPPLPSNGDAVRHNCCPVPAWLIRGEEGSSIAGTAEGFFCAAPSFSPRVLLKAPRCRFSSFSLLIDPGSSNSSPASRPSSRFASSRPLSGASSRPSSPVCDSARTQKRASRLCPPALLPHSPTLLRQTVRNHVGCSQDSDAHADHHVRDCFDLLVPARRSAGRRVSWRSPEAVPRPQDVQGRGSRPTLFRRSCFAAFGGFLYGACLLSTS